MAIELKIGTRGTRAELLYTFTKDFLDENGIKNAGLIHMRPKMILDIMLSAMRLKLNMDLCVH